MVEARGERRSAMLVALPFWHHALALLALLAGLAGFIGTDSAFVTDESYVVIQLDTIEQTGHWTLPHPYPEIDPEGTAFPLHGAERFEDGYVLYGKHPALIYLYLPVHRAFGVAGLVGLSVVGTWAAALVAACLAERVRAGSALLALWLVGAASPLLFDAFVVHAHTIAAALAGAAALIVLRAVDEERPWLGAGAVAAALGVGLLRSEGVLYAAALGGAVGLLGLRRGRVSHVLIGAGLVGAGAGAFLVDRVWSSVVAGSDAVSIESARDAAGSFLEGRGIGALYTLLMPGYRGGTIAESLTLLGATLLVAGAWLLRRRPEDEGAMLLPVAGAAILVGRAALQWGPVPGLLVAFCVGVVGLVLLDAPVSRSTPARLLLAVAGSFVLAVLATQYATGGHTEWGGRYFALAVPLLGAVAAASLHQCLAELPRRSACALAVSLVAAAAGLLVLAVSTVHAAHDRNRERTEAVLAAAGELSTAPGERPLVVTEDNQIPRLARGRYSEARFLLVPPDDVARYLERLTDDGVEELLLVSIDAEATLDRVPQGLEVMGPVLPHALQYDDRGGLISLRRRG